MNPEFLSYNEAKKAGDSVEKNIYTNGQKVYELNHEYLTYYFKDGALKAKGPLIKNKKEGLWQFYHRSGELWKEGAYLKGKKEGRWQRFSAEGQVEEDAHYEKGLKK